MASYSKFQSDNQKYTNKSSRTILNNPSFNPAIDIVGNTYSNIERNLQQWSDLIAYLRWYPDCFYQLITPDTGASIKLGPDQRITLRCLSRFLSTYCVQPRGSGKCVAGDTLILTSEGIREIGYYFNYKNDNNEFIKDLDIEIVNKYGDKEHTCRGIYSGKKPTIKITTNEGYSIEGTYIHPLLVMNKDGLLEYRKLENIKNGDYVCMRRGDNVWGNNLNIDVSNELEKWLASRNKCNNGNLKIRNLPKIITEDIGYFIGLLLGDGGFTRKNLISFSNIDKDVIDRFFYIAENSFGVDYIRRPNKNDYVICDMYLRKYFELIGFYYSDSHLKHIPDRFMQAPKNIIKKILQGLFDTDGCGEKGSITYSSVSEKMIHQIQILLLNFGIVCSVKPKIDKLGHKSYILAISGLNVDIFNNEIGFLCKKKKDRAIILQNKKHNTNIDIIPYQFKYCGEVYNATAKGQKHHFLYHCGKACDNDMTYYRLTQLITAPYEEYPYKDHFKELYELNYFYSKVTQIEYSENDVYDIETIDTHSFVANGFVNHNTLLALMYAFHTCIFYPNVTMALTAQTRENSAKLIQDKYDELIRAFPLLKEEIYSVKTSKDTVVIEFHNGSKLTNVANQQSSKGAHYQRGLVDEDNLTDETTYFDVLEPIFSTVPRRTVGKKCVVDSHERNFQISQLTSSGFRNSPAYYRCLKHFRDMVDLKGEMCLGASWELAAYYGRGASKAEILKKKANSDSISFDMNYRAVWTGASDSALVNISKLMACRTLRNAEYKSDKTHEYVLSMDIARSDNANNNQTSFTILKIIRRKDGKINEVQIPYLMTMPSTANFDLQTIEAKRLAKRFEVVAIIIDDNGLGKSVGDRLVQEQVDPITGESLGCYDTLNSERIPEVSGSPKIVFCYMAQKFDNESIPAFMDAIETGKLRFLEKKDINTYEVDKSGDELIPFIQTDFLVEEISNLKLKYLNNGGLSIDQVVKRNKDRFSSLQYGYWYVMKFLNNAIEDNSDDVEELAKYIMW